MSIPQPVTREDRAGAKRSRKNQTSLRTRLALGTALATIAFGYAGRTAYAGVCTGSGEKRAHGGGRRNMPPPPSVGAATAEYR